MESRVALSREGHLVMPRPNWGLAVLSSAGFLAGATIVYLECSFRAARGDFPSSAASLLGALIASSWAGPATLRGRSALQWTWTVVPVALFLVLEWRAESFAELAGNGTPAAVYEYALRSVEFMVFAAAWLVASPSGGPAPRPARSVSPSRLGLLSVALAFVGLVSFRVYGYAHGIGVSIPERLHAIQNALIIAGCSIYVLAILRVALRFAEETAARRTEKTASDQGRNSDGRKPGTGG